MPRSERTEEALDAFWVCLEDLYRAHRADQMAEPEPPKTSRWKTFWNVFPVLAGVPIVLALVLLTAFTIGRDYQKEHGPQGSECKPGSFRPRTNDGFGGECVNGFWFNWGPPPPM